MKEQFVNAQTAKPPFSTQPNILFIMVDQQRYPTVYETEELRAWQKEYLKAQTILAKNGFTFKNHYAGSTACSPSRTTIYTGQYPSLHGVTQTGGAAKGAYDPDIFWLDPSTVPTMGDYLRVAGYQTYWKGKWHASAADILIPGTKSAYLSYYSENGVPIPSNEERYMRANVLDDFGFNGWIGPEPHGANPRNSGSSAATGVSGRDPVYAEQTVDLIQELDQEYRKKEGHPDKPWFIASSFVNPHDIAIFGAITRVSPQFDFKVDPSVPFIPPAPTATESLSTKPIAQFSYGNVYPQALQPLEDTVFYRRLYYSLQLEADRQICKILNALMKSAFYHNTIVIFTSDHGELLGAHGGLFQKWYQAYEESIHVPLIIHNPVLFKKPAVTTMLTSHVDLLPTLLGMAGLNVEKIQKKLSKAHTEVHPLVGRDLTPLLLGERKFKGAEEPLYFMTDDNVTKGLNQVSAFGIPYHAVVQPNSVETVIAALPTGQGGTNEIWKYSRYFANPQFQTVSGRSEQFPYRGPVAETFNPGCRIDPPSGELIPDQYEMYNLTCDPLEVENLIHHTCPELKQVRKILAGLLREECQKKRLYPTSGEVSEKPSCSYAIQKGDV